VPLLLNFKIEVHNLSYWLAQLMTIATCFSCDGSSDNTLIVKCVVGQANIQELVVNVMVVVGINIKLQKL